MCDQTEVPYLPDDVVWVKLGPVWWPGRVCKKEEIPPEIMKDLRKTPIAIVKFFQEDSFEYVKKLSNIYHYNCLKKNEFIKKGLDMLRLKNRDAPSNMKLFPEDIERAELLTGGNPAILQDDIFLPVEKPTYADLFTTTTKKTPKKVKLEMKKKTPPLKQNTPRLITHPRFLRLSSGHDTDYEVRERKQEPIRAECDEVDTSPPTTYRCTDCEYTTTRLNVIVWHNKSHTRNYASPQMPNKATKRKSTVSMKFKERLSTGNNSSNVECKSDDIEFISATKIPKTNGTLKIRALKTPGRKKSSTVKSAISKVTPNTKETNSRLPTSISNPQVRKPKQVSMPKSDEFQKSLLEDWLEDDIEQETIDKQPAVDESNLPVETAHENVSYSQDGSVTNDFASKNKSCFDFDDSEDHLVIDKSKFKLGRKIPRLLDEVKNGKDNDTASILAPDDVVPLQSSSHSMDIDVTTDYSSHKYNAESEDAVIGEHCMSHVPSQTNQLQEMGVDNEIEIKTEETAADEMPIESALAAIYDGSQKTEVKVEDEAELRNKVDKLLTEMTKTPAKLTEIPRSHKKAHLKAYCESLAYQQAEAEEQAARKAAAEEKASQKAEAEERTEQNVAPEEQIAENLHPETMNIEVSSIPLPSPQKRPVTSEKVKSSVDDTIDLAETSAVQSSQVISSSALPITNEETLVVDRAKIADETTIVDSVKATNDVAAVENAPAYDTSSTPLLTPSTLLTTNVNEGANNVVSPTETCSIAATTAAASARTPPIKFTTTPKLKQINTNQFLRGGQRTFQIINPTDENYKTLINQLSASTASGGQLSPDKASSAEQLKTIKTTLKTSSGKSIVCNFTAAQSQKVLLAKSQASGSPTKIILLNCKKAPIPATGAATAAVSTVAATPASSTPSGRTIDLKGTTAVRLTPNILQKTAAQKATAALAKSTGKNIVLDASTFQTLFQSQQPLCKPATQILLPDVIAESTSQIAAVQSNAAVAPAVSGQSSGIVFVPDDRTQTAISNSTNSGGTNISSNTVDQTVEFNYIVDSSGNLVQVSGDKNVVEAAAPPRDILAKALEDTDGLQTEMALTDATNSVLDACSVTQNTEMAYKADSVYENLTLNTPPIMSAYETPSRAVTIASAISDTSNEMMIVRSGVESTEYIT